MNGISRLILFLQKWSINIYLMNKSFIPILKTENKSEIMPPSFMSEKSQEEFVIILI